MEMAYRDRWQAEIAAMRRVLADLEVKEEAQPFEEKYADHTEEENKQGYTSEPDSDVVVIEDSSKSRPAELPNPVC